MRIGRFVWHDLMTPDVEKAKAFYAALLAWKTRSKVLGSGDGYSVIHDGTRESGGFMHLDPGEGLAPHWMPYVTVADVPSAVRQAAAAGATTCVPPFELAPLGRMSVIEDDQGAFLTLIQENRRWPEHHQPARAGEFVWHTLNTRDLARAIAFYTSLFEWTVEEADLGGLTRTVFKRGGQPVADIVPLRSGWMSSPHWGSAIAVDDLTSAHARSLALGAAELRPPTPAGSLGQHAILVDPTGAAFSLLQPTV